MYIQDNSLHTISDHLFVLHMFNTEAQKSELSGWQLSTRKNFPDEVRKLFSRQKKRVRKSFSRQKSVRKLFLQQKSVLKSFLQQKSVR